MNLHFSLLPAWRGAAPVQHAVLAGDPVTGATTFRIVEALDAGPTYAMITEPIGPRDTSGDLLARLAVRGADLLVQTLDGIADGSAAAVPQPDTGVTLAPKITVADAEIDWTRDDRSDRPGGARLCPASRRLDDLSRRAVQDQLSHAGRRLLASAGPAARRKAKRPRRHR